jgi:AraC-like DNA-binding protein
MLKSADKFKAGNGFWRGLKKLGLTPGAVLRQARLPADLYDGEKNLVTTAQFFALWRAIGELSPDPAAGLKLASEVEPEHHHPGILAALNARNFRDAVERIARYKKLCCPETVHITTKDDECIIETVWLYPDGGEPPLLTDAILASFVHLGRRGTQTLIRPKRVELKRPPEPTEVHERFFRCPVKFQSRHDRLVLYASDLNLPFVTHNADLLEMLDAQLEKALEEKRAMTRVGDQVKWILKRLLSGERPDILLVAKELGMGARTLQRRITDEGSTFRQLLSEARKEMAHQYLSQPAIEINEAAYLLGYDDPNSFFRAFKAWEGTTPAQWRSVRRDTMIAG